MKSAIKIIEMIEETYYQLFLDIYRYENNKNCSKFISLEEKIRLNMTKIDTCLDILEKSENDRLRIILVSRILSYQKLTSEIKRKIPKKYFEN